MLTMADFLKTWVLLLRPLFSPRFLLALAASVRTLYLESVSLCVCVSLSLSLSPSLFSNQRNGQLMVGRGYQFR